ncbi:MAG: SPOR domain-containing protein [Bacteroidales bacterium]|nr:SPOR domain-containing protein [Bacteroidales bacterium]
MLNISTYIEYLLMTQHYAFLPGLGGFVLAEHEASMKPGVVLAPGRTVQFNRFMTHDDGLLANTIMTDTGMSYDDAVKYIRHEVATMLDKVQHHGRYALGKLGYLFFDEECHIAFRPTDTQCIDPLYYGHANLQMRPWQELEAERQAATAPVVEMKRNDVIEVPRYWLHRAAIALLIVVFFFGNLATKHNQPTTSHASMFSTEAIMEHFSTLEAQSWDESWEHAEVPAVVAEEPKQADIAAETIETVVKEIKAPENSKLYYIIVASTTDEKEAQRTLKKFAQKGYDNIGIIERDGRLRLYIDNYAVKSEAETALSELRQNQLFEKAWLLPVKCTKSSSVLSLIDWTPIKLIIKEKDNDRFTMELSYLNQPAERDQG